MSDKPDSEPELRVLDDAAGEDVSSEPVEHLTAGDEKPVEVLRPDKGARFEAKTFEPDIADIMESADEDVDAEEVWGENAYKAPPLGWFVLAGLVVTGLAFWATLSVFEAQPKLKKVVSQKKGLEEQQIRDANDVKATLRAMESAIKGYLEAKSVEDLLPHVRHPERVEPLMQNYYGRGGKLLPSMYSHIVRTRSLGLENEPFVRVTVALKKGKARRLVLQQVHKNYFAVDWESDVCYQQVEWEEFLRQRLNTATMMRVLIKPDTYYAFEFRNEEELDCYRIQALGNDENLYGFVKKGTVVAKQMRDYVTRNRLTEKSEVPQPLILRIRFPKETRSRKCVWIDELVEPRWLFVTSPEKKGKK